MKKYIAIILLSFLAPRLTAQLEQVVVETFAVHDGFVGDTDLSGFTTYRIYADVQDPLDFLSSLFAINECHPMSIRTSGVFYNNEFGGDLGTDLNPALISFFPETEYDSFITIGSAYDGQFPNESVQSAWTDDPYPLTVAFSDENGTDFIANDGAIFAVNGSLNALPQGIDQKILLCQLTTDGEIEFEINLQIFDDGDGINGRIDYVSSGDVGCADPSEVDGIALGLVYPGVCVDPLACNYTEDPMGLPFNENFCDFESCYGCTDVTACNYDQDATFDEGCIYPDGCTEPNACNYNSESLCDDGSCEFLSCLGCTDPVAINYNPDSSIDDGSCEYSFVFGCTHPDATNYDPEANFDDGTCNILGCTSIIAFNYNPDANNDDGSCIFECPDITIIVNMWDTFGDGWNGAVLTIYDEDENIVFEGTLDDALEGDGTSVGVYGVCLPAGFYSFEVTEGAFPEEISWSIQCTGGSEISGNGDTTVPVEFEVSESICLSGCTDEEAANYDPEATISIGNCSYLGCASPGALNYDPLYTVDDGSCLFNIEGYVYSDFLGNGTFDELNDFGLANVPIFELFTGEVCWTNSDGYYRFDSVPESAYHVIVSGINGYDIFTTPSSLTVNTLDFEDGSNFRNFGLSSSTQVLSQEMMYFSEVSEFNCALEPVRHSVVVKNTGNEPINVNALIDLSLHDFDYEQITEIDNFQDGILYFSADNLYPGQQHIFEVDVLAPWPPEEENVLTSSSQVSSTFLDTPVETETLTISNEVNCSAIFLNKHATPIGETDEHFITEDQVLEYRIYFSNNTSETVQNVLIIDTLNTALDLNTFNISSSSHQVLTTLNINTGVIEFLLEDIQLPDNLSDPLGSEGFIVFEVALHSNLEDHQVINNDAYIYFDGNLHLQTNETWHTIFTCDGISEYEITSDSICVYESTQLQIIEDDFTQISWEFNDLPYSTEDSIELVLGQPGSYVIDLQASNDLCVENNSIDLVVHPLPEIDAGLDIEICFGDSVELSAVGESAVWNETEQNVIIVNPNQTSEFIATATNEFGCQNSDDMLVYVNDLPTGIITSNGDLLIAEPADFYQWYFEGEIIEGATEYTYLCSENGNYSVFVTNEFGCSILSDEVFVEVVGISENDEIDVTFYPNPIQSESTLYLSKPGNYRVSLINNLGATVNLWNLENSATLKINNCYPSGIYQLIIHDKNGDAKKLIPVVMAN